jgi:hypothetical protein
LKGRLPKIKEGDHYVLSQKGIQPIHGVKATMKTRLRIIFWTMPLLVILITIIYGKVFFSGLTVPWILVGKPSENLTEIIGIKFSEGKLYMLTTSRDIYSKYFNQYTYGETPSPVQWIKEKDQNILTDPVRNYGGERFTPPLYPFKPIQIFEFGVPATESTFDIRFALSEDGNLWYWSFATGAYQGLFYILVLAIEILAFLLALFINFVIILTRRIVRGFRNLTQMTNHIKLSI